MPGKFTRMKELGSLGSNIRETPPTMLDGWNGTFLSVKLPELETTGTKSNAINEHKKKKLC